MKNKILLTFFQIISFTFIFFGLISLVSSFFAQDEIMLENNQALKREFYAAPESQLGKVSVALTTNIGIRFKERESLPVNSYLDVQEVGDDVGDKTVISGELISQNMITIKEYLNILRTDVLGLLDNAYNREVVLNEFINQLSLRYKNASTKLNKLQAQKTILEAVMTNRDASIESLKTKISTDFSKFDDDSTNENIEEYLVLKDDYIYARTYLIFINKFITQYAFLNEYNKQLLDTLINNKDALSKNSFVVIPDSGDDFLRELDLILDESEYKANNKEDL